MNVGTTMFLSTSGTIKRSKSKNQDVTSVSLSSKTSATTTSTAASTTQLEDHLSANEASQNSFTEKSLDWDFFDNDSDDELSSQVFLPFNRKREVSQRDDMKEDRQRVGRGEKRGGGDKAQPREKMTTFKSNQSKIELVKAAVETILSSGEQRIDQMTKNNDAKASSLSLTSTTRRNSRTKQLKEDIDLMISSSVKDIRRNRLQRKGMQGSQLIASQLRAQRKHEKSTRPSGAKGAHRNSIKEIIPLTSCSSDHSRSDSRQHSSASSTSDEEDAISKTSTTTSSTESRKGRRVSFCLDLTDEDYVDGTIPPIVASQPHISSGSSAMVQQRLDGTRYVLNIQQCIEKKQVSIARRSQIRESLEKLLLEDDESICSIESDSPLLISYSSHSYEGHVHG